MARDPSKRLVGAVAACLCSPLFAHEPDSTNTDGAHGTGALQAPPSHLLQLQNADDYRLKPSPDHLLQSPWGKPAQLPIASPHPVKPDFTITLPYHDEILAATKSVGIEPALVHAVIHVESAYNAAAVSPKGAVGLMQLMPATAKRYGVTDSKDPVQNIRGGTQYLTDLKRLFANDLVLVLAAYNAGENAVFRSGRSIPRIPETLRYVPRVLEEYERLRNRLRRTH